MLPTAAILTSGGRDVTNQRIEAIQGSRVTVLCRGGSNLNWKKGTGSTATSLPTMGAVQILNPQLQKTILTIFSLTSASTGVYACHLGASKIETVTVGEFIYPLLNFL